MVITSLIEHKFITLVSLIYRISFLSLSFVQLTGNSSKYKDYNTISYVLYEVPLTNLRSYKSHLLT